jgi:hypothetical protein
MPRGITIKRRGKPRSFFGGAFPSHCEKTDPDLFLFAGRDRLDRTLLRTSPAVRAQFGIDDIFVIPLADRLHGAFILAGTARNAFIGDKVRHIIILLFMFLQ